ncbi:MAG: hypothetical protein R3B89_06545 [Polyangiaceae bacterium]
MGDSIEPLSAYDAIVAEGTKRARPKGCELGRVALLKAQLESCFRPLREREVALLEVASFDRLKGYAERAVEAETLEDVWGQDLERPAPKRPPLANREPLLRSLVWQESGDSLRAMMEEAFETYRVTGENRGYAEGQREGRLELLLHQLTHKFGAVPPHIQRMLACCSSLNLEYYACRVPSSKTLAESLRRARPESFRMALLKDDAALPLGDPGSLRRVRDEHSRLVSRNALGCLVSDQQREVLALGETRGLTAGIAEGEIQGRIELILFQLHARFQDVPECTRDLLECTSPERLEEIAERLLLAETLEDVLGAG